MISKIYGQTKYKSMFQAGRGKGRKSLIGKLFYLINADFQLFKLSRIFKPDLYLSFASPYAGHVSFLIGKPHISLTDTEHAKLGIISFLPFSDVVLTPEAFNIDLGNRHLRFNGFMEQCYLQKDYFKPNNMILKKLNLKPNKNFNIGVGGAFGSGKTFVLKLDKKIQDKVIELLMKNRIKIQ